MNQLVKTIKPGDIVHIRREIGDDRYFFVQGFCSGITGQHSIVVISTADKSEFPMCENKEGNAVQREVVHIPRDLFDAALKAECVEVYEKFEEMENPVYS